MTCAELERTSALMDGELTGAERAGAEAHLATCQACQAFAETNRTIGAALRSARSPASAGLRGRIVASLRQTPARRPASARPFLWGAFSGAGATSLAAAVLMALLLPPTPSDFASGLAKAHSRALTGDKVVAVRSSDHHKVKPWLSRHAPLSPPVIDFAAQGFPLQGARVDVVKGRTLAVLAYARGAHEIDLYAWPTGGRPVPADNDHLGYHERFWTQGDLAFAAVSDVQADALSQFVALARRPGE